MHKIEKELRQEIKKELNSIDKNKLPKIYDFIQVENGYKRIENMIIQNMITDNMRISATIPHIENML